MEILMTIGERLRAVRALRGKTQDELSDDSGVPQAHISAIERGEIQSPTADTLLKLAKALNVSIDHFLGYKPEKEEAND